MTAAEKYVAAAYLVVFAVILVWVLMMSSKLVRMRNDVDELERRRRDG